MKIERNLSGERVVYLSACGDIGGEVVRDIAFGLLVRFDDGSTQWVDHDKVVVAEAYEYAREGRGPGAR